MNANQKIIACIAIGVLWLGALVALHFFPDLKDQIGQFTGACFTALIGLGAFHAGQVTADPGTQLAAPAALQPAAPGQAGRSLWAYPVLLVTIALGLAMLSGCAGFGAFQQAVVGYEGAAYSGLKQVNDNKLAVSIAVLCEGTSVGAAIRNPQSVATLKAACTNGTSDPNSLFDGKQQPPITINLTVPPATAASGSK